MNNKIKSLWVFLWILSITNLDAQKLTPEKVGLIKQTVVEKNIEEFKKIYSKTHKKAGEERYYKLYEDKSLLDYLVSNGQPYFVEFIVANGYDVTKNDFNSNQHAINRAWDNKKARAKFATAQTDLESSNLEAYDLAGLDKLGEDISRMDFVDRRTKKKFDSIIIYRRINLIDENQRDETGLNLLYNISRRLPTNTKESRAAFDKKFYAVSKNVMKEVMKGQYDYISKVDQSVSGFEELYEYIDNFRLEPWYWMAESYNEMNAERFDTTEVTRFKVVLGNSICELTDAIEQQLGNQLLQSSYMDLLNWEYKFCYTSEDKSCKQKFFADRCASFDRIAKEIKCLISGKMAEKAMAEDPLISRPNFKLFDKDIFESRKGFNNGGLKEIFIGNWRGREGSSATPLFMFLRTKSAVCGSASDPRFKVYQVRYDLVSTQNDRVTDVSEGKTKTYYVEPQYLDFFKNQEGLRKTNSFRKNVFSSMIELAGGSLNMGSSEDLSVFYGAILKEFGCHSNEAKQLEMNLYIMAMESYSLQYFFENPNCSD